MKSAGGDHLPHDIPLWVDPHREIYFITVNCRERFRIADELRVNQWTASNVSGTNRSLGSLRA